MASPKSNHQNEEFGLLSEKAVDDAGKPKTSPGPASGLSRAGSTAKTGLHQGTASPPLDGAAASRTSSSAAAAATFNEGGLRRISVAAEIDEQQAAVAKNKPQGFNTGAQSGPSSPHHGRSAPASDTPRSKGPSIAFKLTGNLDPDNHHADSIGHHMEIRPATSASASCIGVEGAKSPARIHDRDSPKKQQQQDHHHMAAGSRVHDTAHMYGSAAAAAGVTRTESPIISDLHVTTTLVQSAPNTETHTNDAAQPSSLSSTAMLTATEEMQLLHGFDSGIRKHGWLHKLVGKTPQDIEWKKYWFYLVDDRLYYSTDANREHALGKTRYITLDRVPVRPLPHRRKRIDPTRMTTPDVGISLVDSRVMRHLGVKLKPNTCLGVVAGSHTYFLAAESEQEARSWVEALRQQWLHCYKHPLRGADERGMAHATSRILAQNVHLKASLKDMQGKLAGADSDFWRGWLQEKVENRQLQQQLANSATYEVEVKTGKMKGASTDARVYLEMFGPFDEVTTGELRLLNIDTHQRPFQRHALDLFVVKAKNVGLPNHIKVWHDNTGRHPDWFLEYIRIRKKGSGAWAVFPCMRWFSTRLDDCRISRMLFAGHCTPLQQYRVTVVTGDMRGAGTDANVFLIMHGTLGDGQRHILTGGHDDFDRGMTNEFTVEDEELGDLLEITVGHDNSGHHPSWNLEHVIITSIKTDQQFIFPCRQWFDTRVGDGRIERVLPASHDVGKMSSYTFFIATSDIRGAGTDADVHVALHGDLGDSPTTILPSRPEHFERGQTDEFKLQLPYVGKIRSLTIGHNNKGPGPEWHLEMVEVVDNESGRSYYFACGKWLGLGMEDSLLERTLVVLDTDPRGEFTEYKVEFITSTLRGAGTDATVYFQLLGDKADSEVQRVVAPKEAFERGSIDAFTYRMRYLGRLKKMLIQHDNSGDNPAWHLFKVVVTCMKDKQPVVFVCNDWIRSDQPGVYPSVELVPGLPEPSILKYKIQVATSDLRGAGTDANVFVQLHGSQGKLGPVQLDNPAAFERNQVDGFLVEGADVGALVKLVVSVDGKGQRAAWHLDHILVFRDEKLSDNMDTAVYFPCRQWFNKEKGMSKELFPMRRSKDGMVAKIPYVVKVYTSDMKGAGTDANISINLIGERDETGFHLLVANYDTFERGAEDIFTLSMPDVGRPAYLIVRSDGRSAKPSWHLFFVTVESDRHPPAYFLASRWLGPQAKVEARLNVSWDDPRQDRAEYVVTTYTSDIKLAGTDAGITLEILGERASSGRHALIDMSKDTFERAQQDEFRITCRMLGPLRAIRIDSDGRSAKPSWHLDMVVITARGGAERWFFPYHDWIGPPSQCKVEIPATTMDPSFGRKLYKVVTHTSNIRGAGTDANVFIDIRGSQASTGRAVLRNASKDCFERGQSDEFEVKTGDLGDLLEIEIGHDGTGQGPSWHLEQVDITDMKTKQMWYFECDKWFDTQQGDGLTVRVLPASSQNPRTQRNMYQIVVKTATMQGAGTDAKPYVDIFGELANSGRVFLRNANPHALQAGAVDEFPLSCRNLGPLHEMLLGHDNTGFHPAWHPEVVSVTDLTTHITYWFDANKWFDAKQGDGRTERVLRASLQRPLPPTAPVPQHNIAPYEVVVTTSDISGAGTDANVFLIMFGEDGSDTGKLKLDKQGHNDFERGARDVFQITAREVDPLRKIRIGHDNSGLGASWHLASVEITNKKTRQRYLFPCNRWFSKSEDDFQIERDLFPAGSLVVQNVYHVTVLTSDISGAGTDANVFILLYGAKGEAGPFLLDNPKNNFERGMTDEFSIKGEDVGELSRLKVWHDNKGMGAAWHMDLITVTSSANGIRYYFYCGQWLSKEHGLEKTLIASLTDPRLDLPVYTVTTHTSDIAGAGTDAKVFVNLIGQKGDSGPRQLEGPGALFEEGKADSFKLKMVDLGELLELEVWHDNSGLGPGWHLDYIEVHSSANGKVYYFPCSSWFDKKEGDGLIRRRLKATFEDPRTFKASYRVTSVTSNVRGAGTDANVFIIIYGQKGDTGKVDLDNPGKNDFENGQTDVFEFDARNVGPMEKILIGHDNSGLGPGWHLAKVIVENLTTGESVTFECNRWFDKKEDDGAIQRELYPTKEAGHGPGVNWKLTVITGSDFGAGTDADVFVEIHGDHGNYGPHFLAAQNGAFETGSHDVFSLTTPELGVVLELVMGHNNKGVGAAWQLDSCELHNMKTDEKYYFDFKCWLDAKHGLQATRRPRAYSQGANGADGRLSNYRVELTTGANEDGTLEKGDVFINIMGFKGATGRQLLELPPAGFLPNRCEAYAFHQLLDTGSIRQLELGHTAPEPWFVQSVMVLNETTGAKGNFEVARLLHPNEYVTIDVKELTPVDYKVEVQTSDKFSAGTSAKVSMTLFGLQGSTGRVPLEQPGDASKGSLPKICSDACTPGGKAFSRGSLDTFVLSSLPDVGPMTQLEIGHDGTGIAPGWHCAWVRITNLSSGATAYFPCDQWLAKNEADHKTTRMLDAQGQLTAPPPAGAHDHEFIAQDGAAAFVAVHPAAPQDAGQQQLQQHQQLLGLPPAFTPNLMRKMGGTTVGQPGYRVSFHTSNICMAGTNAPVFFELIGENGSSGTILTKGQAGQFSRGSQDVFVYPRLPYLGELLQMRVGTTGQGMFATWHLRHVEVVHISSGARWIFNAHNWVDKKTNWTRVLAAAPV